MVIQLIHHYEECCHAFREAQAKGEALSLSLPPGAVCYMGLGYIHTMIKQASKQYPDVSYHFLCNCGTDASLVQEALRLGFTHVGYTGLAATAEKLQDIAAYYGADLVFSPE